jgi:hypothetical protein
MEVNAQEEITWILWFLAHYLEPDAEWKNSRGEQWSIEKLVRLQTQADVLRGACGGCHGLFAMAFARNNYLKKTNEPLRGLWIDAEQKLQRYISMAQSIQNNDGSFPTKYFKGYGEPADYSERLAAPGHMMEWLMIALPDERLKEPWVRKGIEYLARTIISFRNIQVDCGPLYHALDALVIYRDRMRMMSDQPPIKQEYAEKKPAVQEKPVEVPAKTAMVDVPPEKKTITDSMVADKAPQIVPENNADTAKVENKHPLTTQESNMPILTPDNKKPAATAMGEKNTQGISANKNVNDVLNNANIQKSIILDKNDPFQLPQQMGEADDQSADCGEPVVKTDKKTQLKNVIHALSVPPVNIAAELKSSQDWKKVDRKEKVEEHNTAPLNQSTKQDEQQWKSGENEEVSKNPEAQAVNPEPAQKSDADDKQPEQDMKEQSPKPVAKMDEEDFSLPVPVKQEDKQENEEEGQPAPEIED